MKQFSIFDSSLCLRTGLALGELTRKNILRQSFEYSLRQSKFQKRRSVGKVETKGDRMRRLIYVSIFLIVCAFFLQRTAQASDKIRIGLPADAGHFTFPLAQKRGFLTEEGFEAEIITITGPVANIALSNGDIDYYTGFGSAMRSMLQGSLPSRVVVCYRPPHTS